MTSRRRAAGYFLLPLTIAFLAPGCARVTRVDPVDYVTVAGAKGRARVLTRDGRIYDFRHVGIDSARFVGRVDVVRNVVTRDGHLEAVEGTEEVRLPFSDVETVEIRNSSVLGTALAVGAGLAGVALLIRAFKPVPTTDTTGGGGGGPPVNHQAPHRR